MKTTFTTIIALTMLSGIVLGQTKVGQLYYKITSDSTASVVSELPSNPYYNEGNKPTGEIAIPPTVEIEGRTYTVTNIGWYAFYGCSGLTSINIPNSVTSIGNGAFSDCTGLTSVNIPNSVTSIGYYAFSDCSGLTSVNIPRSVTNIGGYAFYGCSGLTSVNIPSSVTNIERWAFGRCKGLTSINVDATNATYTSQGGVLYSKDKTTLHTCPVGKTGEFIIPNSVTSIGNGAFSYCSGLTSIDIPNSITSIGYGAFSYCSGLTSVNIPSSVTNIGGAAFYGCSGLTSVNIPSSVTNIGGWAFGYCSGLTSINVDATNATYTSQDGVLYSKDKTTLHTCPAGKTGEFIIPNSVTSIESGAFSGCSGLTSVNIPSSVTNIGGTAFYGCSGLTSINIPNSVTSIGYEAFAYCGELKEVTVNWATPLSVSNIFLETPINNATLRVPIGTAEQYRQANMWRNFRYIVENDKKW